MNEELEKLLSKVGTPIVRKTTRAKVLKISGLAILLLFSIWFFAGNRTQALKVQKLEEEAKMNNEFIDKISKLIVLPSEKPIIATIVKVEFLKNNKFFAEANNGDQVIFFEKANKAILYDPKLNRIIDIGPANNLWIDFK